MKLKNTARFLTTLLIPAYLLETMQSVYALSASSSGSGSLPWEEPMSQLAAELTGGTATTIAIIAIFVAGTALIFGEDLGKFARTLLMIVIAVAFLVGAGRFIQPLTGGFGI